MTVKALVALLVVAIAAIAFGVYFFSNYLFARVITPNTKNVTVSPGEAISIPVGTSKTGSSLKVELCSTGSSGCIPVAVGVSEDPVRVRIPIGYKAGQANLQISESQGSQKSSRLRLSIPLTVQ
ncbi:MAG: hypothetical protein HYZ63_01540 [Candidatus Andersenbacteria bacterium]|nr:hypothetical protein [Candidatus Andersenbacteria bacterium]